MLCYCLLVSNTMKDNPNVILFILGLFLSPQMPVRFLSALTAQ